MTSRTTNPCTRALATAIALTAIALVGPFARNYANNVIAQTSASEVEPDATTKARLQVIVKGILAAWNKADIVCLGEDHGSKNDSDLRIHWYNILTSSARLA